MPTVDASIPVLVWASQRANLVEYELNKRFPKWERWIRGESQPTLRQLEKFAQLTHTPIGYFFLPTPPELTLPVPDLRTVGNATVREPSSNLLDTIYLCQQRQDWYRNYAQLNGFDRLPFVGSASVDDSADDVAQVMRDTLGMLIEERRNLSTWTDALRQLVEQAESINVMVMTSSVVGSNSHRKLEVDEFRGFALSDETAPLIFVNGSDSKSAQMFTLAHELTHIWLGISGVSDPSVERVPELKTERWCNSVAAELLVPMAMLRVEYSPDNDLTSELQRLAREFKVSKLVILRRLYDAGFISNESLNRVYSEERERLRILKERDEGGGDFYRSLGARVSPLFARAVLSSTLEGQTLFLDAFRMLGVRKTETLYKAARHFGIAA